MIPLAEYGPRFCLGPMDASGVRCARGPCCIAFPALVEIPGQGKRRKSEEQFGIVQAGSFIPRMNLLTHTLNQIRAKSHREGTQYRSPYLLGESQTGITEGRGAQAAFTLRRKNLFAPLPTCSVGLLFKFFFVRNKTTVVPT